MNDVTIIYTGPIVTRQEARALGLKKYFVEKPCPKGHIDQRFVSSSRCYQCSKNTKDLWVKNNPEKHKAQIERFNSANPEKRLEYERKWRAANEEKVKSNRRRYLKENKGYVNAYNAARKTRKMKATPQWACLDKIREFYLSCPDGWEVDHYYPLQGKTVCGLHVETNLQIISREENLAKSNLMPEDFYGL